jgi:hypothetical protein
VQFSADQSLRASVLSALKDPSQKSFETCNPKLVGIFLHACFGYQPLIRQGPCREVCQLTAAGQSISNGRWRGHARSNNESLPFFMVLKTVIGRLIELYVKATAKPRLPSLGCRRTVPRGTSSRASLLWPARPSYAPTRGKLRKGFPGIKLEKTELTELRDLTESESI